MSRQAEHNKERQRHAEFAIQHSDQGYRTWLCPLHQHWEVLNATYFGGQMRAPHILLDRTAPRALGHCERLTGHGAPLQITLSAQLVFGSNPEWVVHPGGAGHQRAVGDLLTRLTVRHFVLEVEGDDERGYRGYGPRFVHHANRIAVAEGLSPVVVRRWVGDDPSLKVASGWPHCVRPEGYYEDITPKLLARLAPEPVQRDGDGPPPALGTFELILRLLAEGKIDLLKARLRGHIDWLHELRRRSNPVRRAFECGEQEADGSPLRIDDLVIDPTWREWNGGTVQSIAEGIQKDRAYAFLPILADALEDAGCTEGRILRHLRCRTLGHDRRCWVLQALLGETA